MHYTKLELWEKSLDLASSIYTLTERFPDHERYGLRSQMRRAVVSVPCNIAEGQGRLTTRDNRRFVLQARGSLFELQAQILIAERLGYLSSDERLAFYEAASELARLVHGMLRYLTVKMFKPATAKQYRSKSVDAFSEQSENQPTLKAGRPKTNQ